MLEIRLAAENPEQNPINLEFVDTLQDALVLELAPFFSGTSGGSFTHEQMTPSAVWVIAHTLGYRPGGVLVVEYGGQNVEGAVSHINENQLTITFAVAISGYAYLS